MTGNLSQGMRLPFPMILVALAALSLTVPAPASASASTVPTSQQRSPRRAGHVRHCSNAGSPNDFFLANITSRHVSCRAAMRFIIALHGARPDFKSEVTQFRSFTCTPTTEGVAVWVRCVKGRRLIRWINGT